VAMGSGLDENLRRGGSFYVLLWPNARVLGVASGLCALGRGNELQGSRIFRIGNSLEEKSI
jgi:hypothetical protein